MLVFFKAIDEIKEDYNVEDWLKRCIYIIAFTIDFTIINFIAILFTMIYLFYVYCKIQITGALGKSFLKWHDFLLTNLHPKVLYYADYKKAFFCVVILLMVFYLVAMRLKCKNVF